MRKEKIVSKEVSKSKAPAMVKHHIENFLMKFEGYDEFLKILGEEEE